MVKSQNELDNVFVHNGTIFKDFRYEFWRQTVEMYRRPREHGTICSFDVLCAA